MAAIIVADSFGLSFGQMSRASRKPGIEESRHEIFLKNEKIIFDPGICPWRPDGICAKSENYYYRRRGNDC